MNGPKIWEQLFAATLPVYEKALIAGGSPRDWTINKNLNARDFDVFVPAESELDVEIGVRALTQAGWYNVRLIEPGEAGYAPEKLAASNVVAVLDASCDGIGRINVIGKRPDKLDNLELLYCDFDHSMCQFAVTPDLTVHVGEAAKETLDTKFVKLYDADGNETQRLSLKTAARLERMRSRGKSYFWYKWPTADVEQKPKAATYSWSNSMPMNWEAAIPDPRPMFLAGDVMRRMVRNAQF